MNKCILIIAAVLFCFPALAGGIQQGTDATNMTVSGTTLGDWMSAFPAENISPPADRDIVLGTDTILTTDAAKNVVIMNHGGTAITLPASTGTGFGQGFGFNLLNRSDASTLTPASGLIDNVVSLSLERNQDCSIRSIGTGYATSFCSGIYDYNPVFSTPSSITALDNRFTATNATAGRCSYFDASGVMQYTATGVCAPRYDYNETTHVYNGITIESNTGANKIANSMVVGGIAGSAGTIPTGWQVSPTPTGLTRTLTYGTYNGRPYMDLRLNGTTNAAGIYQIFFAPKPSIYAVSGNVGTFSVGVYVSGGTQTNVSSIKQLIDEYSGTSTWEKENSSTITVTGTPTKFNKTVTFSDAQTTHVQPALQLSMTATSAIDITLRIYEPQYSVGAMTSSFVPTYGTAVVRENDNYSIPTPHWLKNDEGTACITFTTRDNKAGVVLADGTAARTILSLTATSYGANDGTARDFNLAQVAAGTKQRACTRWSATTSKLNVAVNGTLGTETAFDGDMDIDATLNIFRDKDNANRTDGWFESFKAFTYPLSDAEMATESTP